MNFKDSFDFLSQIYGIDIPRALSKKKSTLDIVSACKNINELRIEVEKFDGCLLKKTANKTVFGDGNPDAKVMLIGEAPGASEDLEGIPFCGESGKLLDAMFDAIGLSRKENLYITNTIFWRPPGNRTPSYDEVESCRPFVEKHISLINPKLIIMVGATAASMMLGPDTKISSLRQKYYEYTNPFLNKTIPVTAIFHPAYLLRQPMQKKASWYDLIKIQQFIKETLKF